MSPSLSVRLAPWIATIALFVVWEAVCLIFRIPPFFLPVGTKDPLLPDTRRLGEALTKMGVEAETEYYPGELHAFHAFVMRKNAQKCWRDTFAFLDKHVSR